MYSGRGPARRCNHGLAIYIGWQLYKCDDCGYCGSLTRSSRGINLTNRPEPVFTSAQWASIDRPDDVA